jgi:hypothetical protein
LIAGKRIRYECAHVIPLGAGQKFVEISGVAHQIGLGQYLPSVLIDHSVRRFSRVDIVNAYLVPVASLAI